MKYDIKPEHPGEVPEVIARIQAAGPEFRGLIRQILEEAAEAGRKVAEAGAPRGPILERNDGGRISDSILVDQVSYAAGGAGGGGYYTVRLYASSAIAPHLPYVFEGTANEGTGKIYPARGNVLAMRKEGEEVVFRSWVHGQKPQTRWWEDAHAAVEGVISGGIQEMDL